MKYLYLKFYDYHDFLSRYYVKLINCEDDTYYCSFVNDGENIDENLDNSEEIEEEDYFVLTENSENKDLLKKILTNIIIK